ncbi:MAG: hypothetical protein ACI8TX_002081, partial [Hyphomicrobiaceae bacterium]
MTASPVSGSFVSSGRWRDRFHRGVALASFEDDLDPPAFRSLYGSVAEGSAAKVYNSRNMEAA